MSAVAWIFAAAWVVTSLCFVVVNFDRQLWQDRALRRQSVLSDLMARHAALLLTLRAMGYPVPDVEVVDMSDLDEVETVADVLRIPIQREGL